MRQRIYDRVVYVVEIEGVGVKVGVTGRVDQRIGVHRASAANHGRTVGRVWLSPWHETPSAFAHEGMVIKKFGNGTRSEYIAASYDDVVEYASSFTFILADSEALAKQAKDAGERLVALVCGGLRDNEVKDSIAEVNVVKARMAHSAIEHLFDIIQALASGEVETVDHGIISFSKQDMMGMSADLHRWLLHLAVYSDYEVSDDQLKIHRETIDDGEVFHVQLNDTMKLSSQNTTETNK